MPVPPTIRWVPLTVPNGFGSNTPTFKAVSVPRSVVISSIPVYASAGHGGRVDLRVGYDANSAPDGRACDDPAGDPPDRHELLQVQLRLVACVDRHTHSCRIGRLGCNCTFQHVCLLVFIRLCLNTIAA